MISKLNTCPHRGLIQTYFALLTIKPRGDFETVDSDIE